MKDFFITTAIAYVNSRPHIGFALELVLADTFARYKRLTGEKVFLTTGTDEHGQKVYQKAILEGKDVRKLVDENALLFNELADRLKISYDRFIRTTDRDHIETAKWLWLEVYKKGDLYLKDYEGFYCVGCEAFKERDEISDGKCPLHNQKVEKVSEKNWFFRLSKYAPKIAEIIKEGLIEIIPDHREREVLNFLKQAKDISVSRSFERLPWGIKAPNDSNQVMYVWFDALTNYLTSARTAKQNFPIAYGDFGRWPADLQIIGKDICRFHAVIWQSMLLSAGFSPSKKLLVHGFITLSGEKISKSSGNVIDPFNLIDEWGEDALRYYLLRYIPTTEDGDFSTELFRKVYESDLANDLGNLLQRFLVLVRRNNINLSGFIEHVPELPGWYKDKMENFAFADVLNKIWEIIAEANALFNKEKPWEQIKKDPKKACQTLGIIYHFLLDISYFLSPFLPNLSSKVNSQLETFKPEILFPKK